MKYFSILFVLVFLGCKTHQQVKNNTSSKNKDWSITSEKNYQNQNNVTIKITNSTENDLVIFDPFSKKVEKFDGTNWQKIKLPYCPCGTCPPPPETMPIATNNEHLFTWDKNVVSCKNGNKVSKKMQSGRYRVTFNYGKSQNVRSFEKLVVEFEI